MALNDHELFELGFTLRGDGSFVSSCRVVFRLVEDEGETGKIFYKLKSALAKEHFGTSCMKVITLSKGWKKI